MQKQFSPNQRAAIAAAPRDQKARLKSQYANQNAATKAAPKAKPRAQRRAPRRARAGGVMPSVGKIFSPLDPRPIPTLLSEGFAFPFSGLIRAQGIAGTNARTLYVLANTGLTATIGATVTNANPPTIDVHSVPTLVDASDAGGPTSGRAMKASLSITNITQKLNRMGKVYILNAAQRMVLPAQPSLVTQAQWNALMDKIVAHPKCRGYDGGSDFDGMKEIITYPCGQAEYVTYHPWEGAVTADRFFSNFTEWPGVHTQHPHVNRPMSTVYVVVETVGTHQDYEMSYRSSHYLRLPVDSISGQAMRPVPTAKSEHLNRIRDHAEQTANTLRSITGAVSAGVDLFTSVRPLMNFGLAELAVP